MTQKQIFKIPNESLKNEEASNINIIDSFDGKFFFLSNFYPCTVTVGNYAFSSSENAYQAMKSLDRNDWIKFKDIKPGAAKRLGRQLPLREDWDIVRLDVMGSVVQNKFRYNSELQKKLLDTGDAILIEGNTWGDTFWGVCNGVGENNLGKILMDVCAELFRQHKMDAEGTKITKETDDVLNYPCPVCAFKGIGNYCEAYYGKENCSSYKAWLESEEGYYDRA